MTLGNRKPRLICCLCGYIHDISLGPMQLIFVELSCLQAKIANVHAKIEFQVEINPHDLEK